MVDGRSLVVTAFWLCKTLYYYSCPPGAVLLVDTAGDIGFNHHNPSDPLEPSLTTLDPQVP